MTLFCALPLVKDVQVAPRCGYPGGATLPPLAQLLLILMETSFTAQLPESQCFDL